MVVNITNQGTHNAVFIDANALPVWRAGIAADAVAIAPDQPLIRTAILTFGQVSGCFGHV